MSSPLGIAIKFTTYAKQALGSFAEMNSSLIDDFMRKYYQKFKSKVSQMVYFKERKGEEK